METTVSPNILDVTVLEPRQKHPTIFSRFDEIPQGESLIIHNDHDPKPLYYQLLGERGSIFNWEYLEQGPESWKVKITKRESNEGQETMGQIVAKDLSKAQVFKKYGLDFCCGGKKTLKEACAEKGIALSMVENELQHTGKFQSSRPLPYDDWSLDFLADYIVNTHHSYVRKNLPDIRTYAEKVMKVHSRVHPELLPIYQLVEEIYAELMAHMIKEENILFPYIKELVAAKNNLTTLHGSAFGTVQNPINMMEMEHELVGNNLAKIRQLSKDYLLPADACASYSLLYHLLGEFEEDLHMHVHLENNILFPKAIAIEKQLR